MPRDGSGNYSLASNTLAVSGDAISSTKFNSLVQDLESDANVDRPVAAGGTGASTASAARTNLGLAIGTDVQAYDAGLLSIAGLTTAADRSIYTTASDTYAVYTLTAAGRAILDDADASAQRTTLGLGTAALKNTGTSGDAVPLLNVANTFGAEQTFPFGISASSIELTDTSAAFIDFKNNAAADYHARIMLSGGTGTSGVSGTLQIFSAALTNNGNVIWHAGNDGAGSGLDADLLDGYNVGTSGATIPLCSGVNSFASGQVFLGEINIDSNGFARTVYKDGGVTNWTTGLRADNDVNYYIFQEAGASGVGAIIITGSGFSYNGNTVWHAGNDGAGSGLDADTLDGVQGSAFALVATDNAFARNLTFSGYRNIILPTGNAAGRVQGRYDTTGATHDHLIIGTNWLRAASGSSGAVDSSALGTAEIEIVATNAGPGVVRIRTGAVNTAPSDQAVIDNTGLQARTSVSTETSGTLTSSSANKTIQLTGDPTINNSVFSAGDIILIYAGASSRTITQGASVTMRLGGTATTGSRTLAARGVAMLFFVSSSEVVVSGGAVT